MFPIYVHDHQHSDTDHNSDFIPIEREAINPEWNKMEWNQLGHVCVLSFLSFSFECLLWSLNVALHHLLYTIFLFLPK